MSSPTGLERPFEDDELLVSKTDERGNITYANSAFLRVSGYSEEEAVGEPHDLVRHPEMPRCLFRLLWDTISSGRDFFGCFANQAKNGDHYWVLAHIAPSTGADGRQEYHCTCRTALKGSVRMMEGLYRDIRRAEQREQDADAAIRAGMECLESTLLQAEMSYDEFVFSLEAVSA